MNTRARGDPWEIPEWRALHREASLVRQLLGSGATALGRANYADAKGEYYNAFFGLSVGIERLAKLILIVDHAAANSGKLPSQKSIKNYGHKLANLIDVVSEVVARRKIATSHQQPDDDISRSVIRCLDSFADAQRGRYANFSALGDPNIEQEYEPIRKWWSEVVVLILRKHFEGTRAEKRVLANADTAHALMSQMSSVLYFDEQGNVIRDIRSASLRTGQTEFAQAYGRYYVLRIVRWLAEVFDQLCHHATYTLGMDAFFGHPEFLSGFQADDSFLRERKIWPIS